MTATITRKLYRSPNSVFNEQDATGFILTSDRSNEPNL